MAGPGVHVRVCVPMHYKDIHVHTHEIFLCNEGQSSTFFSLKEYIYLLLQSKLVEDLKLKLFDF